MTRLHISVPDEMGEYLNKNCISPSKLLQERIRALMEGENNCRCPLCGNQLGKPSEIDYNSEGWICTNHDGFEVRIIKRKVMK